MGDDCKETCVKTIQIEVLKKNVRSIYEDLSCGWSKNKPKVKKDNILNTQC